MNLLSVENNAKFQITWTSIEGRWGDGMGTRNERKIMKTPRQLGAIISLLFLPGPGRQWNGGGTCTKLIITVQRVGNE